MSDERGITVDHSTEYRCVYRFSEKQPGVFFKGLSKA
jgi:transposase-like protein